VRSMVWETLVEDEILDVQLDTLSPEELLREVCRKIGRMPPSDRPPQGRDDAAEAEPDDGLADHEAEADRPRSPDESAIGRPLPSRRNRTAAEGRCGTTA
jgi:hypothetical protein